MDYYYTAPDDAAALSARDLPGGPMPGSVFASAEAKDVLACPHLEQLVGLASGMVGENLVPQLKTLWPKPESFEPGTMITRLPETLRDDLAEMEMTPAIAENWAAQLWGFEPDHAAAVGMDIIRIARSGRDAGQPLYWWSEM
jgi:hypothetical protein